MVRQSEQPGCIPAGVTGVDTFFQIVGESTSRNPNTLDGHKVQLHGLIAYRQPTTTRTNEPYPPECQGFFVVCSATMHDDGSSKVRTRASVRATGRHAAGIKSLRDDLNKFGPTQYCTIDNPYTTDSKRKRVGRSRVWRNWRSVSPRVSADGDHDHS